MCVIEFVLMLFIIFCVSCRLSLGCLVLLFVRCVIGCVWLRVSVVF